MVLLEEIVFDSQAREVAEMAGQHMIRKLSLSAVAGLALAVTPISAAPAAHADDLDWILDLFNPADWAAPAADTGVTTFDWGALFDPANALVGPADDTGLQSFADSLFGNFSVDANTYDMIHSFQQDWINSDFGQFIDNSINLLSGQFLIGNGADGIDDGTLGQAAGGDGGLWFGDGGGADGGIGGDGGAAGTLIGIGIGIGGAGADGGVGGQDGPPAPSGAAP